MSIKVYLDNNFFDEYDRCQDLLLKSKIKRAFQTKQFAFYPSLELLNEMIRILESEKRRNLWIKRRSLFWDFCPQGFLNQWGILIQKEIFGFPDSIYLTNNQIQQIKQNMFRIGRAEEIDEIAEIVKKENYGHWEYFKKTQQEIRLKRTQGLKRGDIKNFDEFNKKYWKIHSIPLLEEVISREENDKGKVKEKALKIFNAIEAYPYVNAFLRTIAANFFWYLLEDREVKKNDYYDSIQLIYMVGLDALISNDDDLKKICGLVFSNEKKVLAFEDINSLLLS